MLELTIGSLEIVELADKFLIYVVNYLLVDLYDIVDCLRGNLDMVGLISWNWRRLFLYFTIFSVFDGQYWSAVLLIFAAILLEEQILFEYFSKSWKLSD